MLRTIRTSVAVMALMVASGTASQAAVCATAPEEAALEMRVLQSELMVAALTCSQRDSYNAFAKRFKADLGQHGKALRGFFKRHYGASGKKRLDRFVTRIANESSQRSMRNSGAYCADADALYRTVLNLEGRQLAVFASEQGFAASHGVNSCTASAAAK